MFNYKSVSQAWQDIFVHSICGANGTYIEIGAYKPKKANNTYNLEKHFNWTGFSVEINNRYKNDWEKGRKNKIYWADALEFNYLKAIEEQLLPKKINYLSCDIEPPNNTLTALKRVINQDVLFDCITFEHDRANDRWKDDKTDYEKLATEFLKANGYKVAVTDVYAFNDPTYIFETWYVHNSIDFNPMTFDEWIIMEKGKLK
jgi:hypothetical protein